MTGVLRKIALTLLHARELQQAAYAQGPAQENDLHLRAAADWLLNAQQAAGGGGYAHSRHFLYGWQPGYPETTGYILPSLLRLSRRWQDQRLRESVAAALRWLLSVQHADGWFPDLSGQPQVFDTGQILIGLNDVVVSASELAQPQAQMQAARWLLSVQDDSGAFIRHAYNNRPHSYYSRVGAALLTAGRLCDVPDFVQAGQRNLAWTLAQQQDNGFFAHSSFDDRPPFLHTIVYVLEGLLDGYDQNRDPALVKAVLRQARPLLLASRRDGHLRSQYHPDYSVANPEYCLTGMAQWAGVCARLARLEPEEPHWYSEALKTITWLKSHQILCNTPALHGGIVGSLPLRGAYMTASIPNWAVKFFIDALTESEIRSIGTAAGN